MNKIFRVIYNQTTQVWQAVSEISKTHGKSKSSQELNGSTTKASSSAFAIKTLTLAVVLGAAQSAHALVFLPMGQHAEDYVPSWVVGGGGYYGQSGRTAVNPAPINNAPAPNGVMSPNYGGNTANVPTTSLQPAMGGSLTPAPINNAPIANGTMTPTAGTTVSSTSMQPAPAVKLGSISDLLSGKPSITIPTDQNGSVKLGADLNKPNGSIGFNQNGSGFDLTGDPFGKGSLTGNISGNKVTVGADLNKGNATLGYDNKGNGVSITNGIDGSGSITGSVLGNKVTVDSSGKVSTDLSNMDPLKPGAASNTMVINGITAALGGKPGVSIPVNGSVDNGTLNAGVDASKGTSNLGYDQHGNGVSLVSGTDGSNNINANYGGNKITIGSNGAFGVETSDGKKYGFSTQKDKDGNNVGGMPNPLDVIKNGGLGGIVKLGHDTVNGVLGLTHIAGEDTPNEVSPGAPDQNDPGSVVNGAFTPGPIPIPTFKPGNPSGATASTDSATANSGSATATQPATVTNIPGQPVMTPATVQNPSIVPGVGPVPSSPMNGAPLSPTIVGPQAYGGTGYMNLFAMPDNFAGNEEQLVVAPSVPNISTYAAPEESAVATRGASAAPVMNLMSLPDNPKWPPFTEEPQPIVLAALPVDPSVAVQPENNDVVYLGDANNLKGGELRYHRYPGAPMNQQGTGEWQMYDPRFKDDTHDGWVEIKWRDGFGYFVSGRDNEQWCGGAGDFNNCSTPYYFYPQASEGDGLKSFTHTVNRDPNSKVVVDKENNNINFNAGNGVTAFRDQDGSIDIIANIDNDTITLDDQGRLKANIPPGEEAAPWNFQVNGEQGGSVAPGGNLNFTSENKTVAIKPSEDGKAIDFGVKVDGSTITVGDDGTLSAVIPENKAGWDGFTANINGEAGPVVNQENPNLNFVDGEGTAVTNTDGNIAYNVKDAGVAIGDDGRAAAPQDPAGYVNGKAFTDTVNNLAWNNTVNSADSQAVKAGDTVDFANGKGTLASRNDNGSIVFDANVDGDTITFDDQGRLKANIPAAQEAAGWNAVIGSNEPVAVKDGDTVKFVNGNVTSVSGTPEEGIKYDVNVDNDTITIDDQGRLKANIPAGEEAAPWNFKVNGAQGGSVAPGGDLDYVSTDKSVNIATTEDGKGIDFGVNVDGSTIKIGDDGKLSAVIPEAKDGWDGFTANVNGEAGPVVNQENPNLDFIDGEGTTVTNTDGKLAYNVKNAGISIGDDGKAAAPQDPAGFVNGKDFTDTVNNLAWNNSVNGADAQPVKAGDTVDFANGKGTTASRNENGSITFDANVDGDTITFDDQGRLKANIPAAEEAAPWNFKVNGADGGAVAPGGDLDFISSDQSVNIQTAQDGKAIDFGVNVDGSTIKIGEDGKLTAVIPESKAGWDGFTAYINGQTGPVVNQENPRLNFVDGDGTTVSSNDNGIAYNVVKAGINLDSNGRLANPANPAGFVDGANFVDVVNKLGWNAQVKTDDPTHVGFGDTVKFIDGEGTTVSGDAVNGIKWNALVDNKTIKINDKGELTAIVTPSNSGSSGSSTADDGSQINQGFIVPRGSRPAITTFAADASTVAPDNVFASFDETATYAGVNEIDDLQNQVQDLKEAGFGLKDQDGNEFKQELGTTAAIVGDENKNIATKVVDQQDGSKAISVQLADDLHLIDEDEKSQWNAHGIGFAGANGDKTAIAANTIALGDKVDNRFTATSRGIGVADTAGNAAAVTANGLILQDQNGNGAELNQTGIAFKPANGEAVTLSANGLNNAGNKVVGVASGEVSASSTDAINGSQLFSTNQKIDSLVDNIKQGPNAVLKGMDFGGDTGKDFNSQLGAKVTITGGVNQPEQLTYGNLGVVSDGQSALALGLSKNLRGLDSVQTGATTVSNSGVVINSPVPGNNANVVSLTASGLNNGGNRITNVAPAVEGTDAVNLNQLNEFGQQVNNMGTQINQSINDLRNDLSGDMRRIENNARAGTASALAQGGLPTASMPNEKLVTVGGGVYHGEAGYAIGISTVSPNGKWILKGTATGDSRNNYGGSGAIGYRWF